MTVTATTTLDGGPDFEVALPADLGALAPVRREVGRRLGAHGVDPDTLDDVLLVVCELCTNAIAASDGIDAPVRVRVRLGAAAIVVDVENLGPSFDALDRIGQRGADAEGGRGLTIVLALSDDVQVQFDDGRCTVRAIITCVVG